MRNGSRRFAERRAAGAAGGPAPPAFVERFASVLREHIAKGGESSLAHAYELGREALDAGISVLDMTLVHQGVLLDGLSSSRSVVAARQLVEAATPFLLESLSPFEMGQRASHEANLALRRMNDALEDQARTISHLLHDEAGQLVVSVMLALEAACAAAEPRDALASVRGDLRSLVERLRSLSHDLHPPVLEDLGLVAAAEALAQRLSSQLPLEICVTSGLDGRLPAAIETALYRVVQEALANVVKHANATRVSIDFRRLRRDAICVVADDGVGLQGQASVHGASPGGLGLRGIRERLASVGGHLRIAARAERGVELRVSVPVSE